jgi:hypothetical protein
MKRNPFDETDPLGHMGAEEEDPFDLVHVRAVPFSGHRTFSDVPPSDVVPPSPPTEVEHDWPDHLDEALPAGIPHRRTARQVLVQIAGWALLVLGVWGVTRVLEQPRAREAILEWVTLGHERQVRAVKRTIEGTLRGGGDR